MALETDIALMERNVEQLAKMLDDSDVEDALLAEAVATRDEMRARVNVKTGTLREAIVAKTFTRKRAGRPAVFVTVDRGKAPHADNVEFGHGGPNPAPPHPFFRPVIDARKNRPMKIAEAIIRGKIKQVTK